jgi:hypothetical protein
LLPPARGAAQQAGNGRLRRKLHQRATCRQPRRRRFGRARPVRVKLVAALIS